MRAFSKWALNATRLRFSVFNLRERFVQGGGRASDSSGGIDRDVCPVLNKPSAGFHFQAADLVILENQIGSVPVFDNGSHRPLWLA